MSESPRWRWMGPHSQAWVQNLCLRPWSPINIGRHSQVHSTMSNWTNATQTRDADMVSHGDAPQDRVKITGRPPGLRTQLVYGDLIKDLQERMKGSLRDEPKVVDNGSDLSTLPTLLKSGFKKVQIWPPNLGPKGRHN